jgi:hypothetical protein
MPAHSDPAKDEPDRPPHNAHLAIGENVPDVDEDEIYRQIGLYVVLFQCLQDVLFQICWLLAEPMYEPPDRKSLSKMTFSQLVSEAGRRVHAFLASTDRTTSEFEVNFAKRFHAQLGRCREIGQERNQVVHSGFVFLESFDRLRGIVMSDMRPGRGDDPVRIENEYLTAESFDERQRKIAETTVGLSMSKTQLIHWR